MKNPEEPKIIDIKSYELQVSFGSLGQGPAEFIGVRQIISDPNNKENMVLFHLLWVAEG